MFLYCFLLLTILFTLHVFDKFHHSIVYCSVAAATVNCWWTSRSCFFIFSVSCCSWNPLSDFSENYCMESFEKEDLISFSKGISRRTYPEVFPRKGVLKICSNFTGEHQCRSVALIKLLCNFIEITLRHWCSPAICCISSEHLFLRTPLNGCYWIHVLLFLHFCVWLNVCNEVCLIF